jgi:hypothetical protein
MQNIGLMMTYNEEDIIEETMESHKKYFDKILVLDGSTDKTPEILQSYDNVVYYLRDEQIFPKRKITDGVRQFLLEEAQKRYGYEGWFTLLHGDEIFVDNPNEIAEKAEKQGADIVNWHMMQFFLHTSQREDYDDLAPLEKRLKYYNFGDLEIRQFKNKQGIYFKLDQIARVLPYGLKNIPLWDYPIIRHYQKRSIRQLQKRPSTGFMLDKTSQQTKEKDVEKIKDILFKEKIDSHYKQTRVYDGSFHNFEPGNRPSFLTQWLTWWKYKEMDLGVAGLLIPSKHMEYRKRIFR